jgi:hypothetical protein
MAGGIAPSVSPAAVSASSVSPALTSTPSAAAAPAALTWTLRPGCGRDIDVGAADYVFLQQLVTVVWVVGCNPVPGGFGIYWGTGDGSWDPVPGGALSIAGTVGTEASGVLVTNDVNQIWQDSEQGGVVGPWSLLRGCGSDIDKGVFGSVWVVGCNPAPGGYGIYKSNGNDWTPEPGGAVRIGVDPNGNPWVTNSVGQIYSSS